MARTFKEKDIRDLKVLKRYFELVQKDSVKMLSSNKAMERVNQKEWSFILYQNQAVVLPKFLETIFKYSSEEVLIKFQKFLKNNNLSFHMRVIGQKV